MEIFHDICPKEAYSKLILINLKLQIFDAFDIIVIVFLLKVVKHVLKVFPLNKLDYLKQSIFILKCYKDFKAVNFTSLTFYMNQRNIVDWY